MRFYQAIAYRINKILHDKQEFLHLKCTFMSFAIKNFALIAVIKDHDGNLHSAPIYKPGLSRCLRVIPGFKWNDTSCLKPLDAVEILLDKMKEHDMHIQVGNISLARFASQELLRQDETLESVLIEHDLHVK